MDAEYDTDELAELPTDSESELVESEPEEEAVQYEEQCQPILGGGGK